MSNLPLDLDKTKAPSKNTSESSLNTKGKNITALFVWVFTVLTVLTLLSAWYHINKLKEFTLYNTYMQARSSMVKDFYLLIAVAEIGYMYSPPTDGTNNIDLDESPNYFNFIRYNPPKLLNFTYKTNADTKLISRLLSLDLSQADGTADAWEEQAYAKLQKNKSDIVQEVNNLNNERFMRFLAPVVASAPCMACHTDSKVGDWVGLISVSVSLEEALEKEKSAIGILIIIYVGIWLFMSTLLIWGGKKLKQYTFELRTKDIEVEAAKAASKSKSEFLANMSHEVRTPLNGVLGMAELLSYTKLDADQYDRVKNIRKAGKGLLNVLNDILDFSKIDAGKLDLEVQAFPIHEVVYDVMQTLAPVAHNKNLEFIAHISPEIPTSVYGDALRLRQVLLNLVGNAIKFTKEGEISLTVNLLDKQDTTTQLQFNISDTGAGITQEQLEKIFDPFEQADTSTTRQYGGTGLGLAISNKLVSFMGGELQAKSVHGKGSTFWFVLSFNWDPNAPQEKLNVSSETLQDMHVLIVDDNETNRQILLEQLLHWNMRPVAYATVDQALKGLKKANHSEHTESRVSLVISDMQMPEKDGIDLAKIMNEDQSLSHIPIILLTSGDFPDENYKHLFARVLRKPTRSTDLFLAMLHTIGAISTDNLQNEKQQHATKSLRPLKILLVEDMEMNQLVAKEMLGMLGHSVRIANHGQEALDILEHETFDIVLMDIQMPVLDGVQTLAEIRKREHAQNLDIHLPVVAMTAHALKGEKESYLNAGMDDYLSKPITFESLAATLERVTLHFDLGRSQQIEIDAHEILPKQENGILSPYNVLDVALFENSFAGDTSLVVMSMGIYLRDMPDLLEKIEKSIQNSDAEGLSEAAHSLKGLTGYYNKSELYSYCKDLEQMGKDGDLINHMNNALNLLQSLKQKIGLLTNDMQDYINEYSLK